MELRQLRYFVAAAEAGTISRAADRCGIAQPSLSQQVRALEHSLGVTLFDRLGRGVALTDAGRALLPRAKRILAEVRDTEERLVHDVDHGVGALAIGAIPTMAPYLLPDLLATLRTEFPECELTVRENFTERIVEALVGNEIDIAILSTPIDNEHVDLRVLGTEPLLVVAPAEHPLADVDAISLPDLRDQPTIVLHEMHCLGQQISGFCATRRIARRVVCQTTQLPTVLELVSRGLGISLVPRMAAEADHATDRVYLHLRRSPPTREIAVATRTGRSRSVVARRLESLLAERLALQSS